MAMKVSMKKVLYEVEDKFPSKDPIKLIVIVKKVYRLKFGGFYLQSKIIKTKKNVLNR